jgi:uncharacterized membrane-anchored protein YhcB (DUF1043 family)
MVPWWFVALGLTLGTLLGMVVISLGAASQSSDQEIERMRRSLRDLRDLSDLPS